MDISCPHCGSVQPQNRSICAVCGGALNESMEPATPLRPKRPPAYSRRRLITGLVVGGVGLAALGSCVGTMLLSERGFLSPRSTPAPTPVDKHRVLNLLLGNSPLSDATWLPDNTQLLVFDFQTLFLLDVHQGEKTWVQSSVFPPQGLLSLMLWSSDRRYVAEVGDAGSVPNDEFRAVAWDLLSKQQIWTSPPLGHLGNTFYPCALAPSGASVAFCQDTGDSINSASNTIVDIWDMQQNRLIKDWTVQEPGQTGDFAVTWMVWSPDTTRLAVICAGGSVQLWKAATGSRLWTASIDNGRGASIQWSPNGATLALSLGSALDTPILILDAHTGQFLFQIAGVDFSRYRLNMNGLGLRTGSTQQNGPVVWSSDGQRLAWLDDKDNTFRVRVCDARTGRSVFTCQPVEGRLTGCSWSPDGRYLAAGTIAGGSAADETWGEASTIQFWDAHSGKALFAYQAPRAPGQLSWSPDSHFLAINTPQSYGQVGIHMEFFHFALQVFQVA